jgi:hypothetical protein
VIESECGAHSDRARRKTRDRVRMWCSFGQSLKESPGPSPNAVLIRTEREGKPGTESECGAHSDRARRKTRDRVRMRCSFGQGARESTRPSPNGMFIRTKREGKPVTESECDAHSDKARREMCDRVRIRRSFGQRAKENA